MGPGWAAYANMYAALIVMSLLCSGAITLLFWARDRLLVWQKGVVKWERSLWSKLPHRAAGAALDIARVNHAFDIDGARLLVLEDVSFRSSRGVRGAARSVRLRQVHLAAAGRGPGAAAVRVRCAKTEPLSARLFPTRVVVFQDPTLFPWRTVWDNVALGLEAQGILKSQRYRVDAAIDLVGLSGFRKAYPHQLSGGMAQRVALARALVNDPKILILDEPLGKLDSLTRIAMQAELVSLWQRSGFTTLLVTHDVEEALFLAHRVIVFSDRPARIKADIAVDVPIPGTAVIPNWPNCAGKFWDCSDWKRHGEGPRTLNSRTAADGVNRKPVRDCQPACD